MEQGEREFPQVNSRSQMGSRDWKIISISHWSNVISSLIGRNKIWLWEDPRLCQTKYSELWMYKNMRKRNNVILHGEVHSVDQVVARHQQVQPLPELKEQEWACLACFHKHLFAITAVMNVLNILSHTAWFQSYIDWVNHAWLGREDTFSVRVGIKKLLLTCHRQGYFTYQP